MVRVRVRYSGRVQGVGFRATCSGVAAGFRVTGWVRNEPEGDVTLEAQGEPDVIEQFLSAIRERLGRFIRTESRSEIAPIPDEAFPFRVAY